jgi:hypothetical protein
MVANGPAPAFTWSCGRPGPFGCGDAREPTRADLGADSVPILVVVIPGERAAGVDVFMVVIFLLTPNMRYLVIWPRVSLG